MARAEQVAPRPGWSWARARTRVAAVPAVAWLVGLVALSTILRFLLSRGISAPFLFQDELLYSELGKSFGTTGHFALRGVPDLAGVGRVYPMLISPAYAIFTSLPHAYVAVKAINSLLMSLAAVPVYLVARRLLAPVPSLVAAVLTLSLPWLFYSGTVMTENAFFPAFLFWFYLLVLTLERPTVLRQVGMLALLGIAYETRPQAVALVPAVVTALVLVIVGDACFTAERPRWRFAVRRAAAFWPTALLLALAALLFAVVELGVRGQTLSQALLQAYAKLGSVHYSVGSVLRWTLWHVGELDLVTGVIPFAAFIAVLLSAFTPRATPALRAFAAAAFASCLWILVEVGAFASSPFGHRIQDRPLFCLVPLLLVALVVWAVGLAGREWRLAGIGALVAAALPGAVPVAGALGVNTVNDAFGLLSIWVLRDKVTSVNGTAIAITLAAMAAAGLFLLLPRRLAAVPVAAVFLFFVYGNHSVDFFTHNASLGSLKGGIQQQQKDWIDNAVGSSPDVAALFSGNRDYVTLWENEFFNRSVGPVYNFIGPPDGLPQATVVPASKDGTLLAAGVTPVHARYAFADNTLLVKGKKVAEDAPLGLTVYRTNGPVRLKGKLTGIYADQWSGPTATFTGYGCPRRGKLGLLLAGEPKLQPPRVNVVASSGGKTLARLSVPTTKRPHRFTVPVVSSDGSCQVDFAISPTSIPANTIGGQDQRELGIRFLGFSVGR